MAQDGGGNEACGFLADEAMWYPTAMAIEKSQGDRRTSPLWWRFVRHLVIPLFIGILICIGISVIPLPGTDDPPSFTFDLAFDIERTAPGGTKYTVNNSIATFDLGVAADDKYCGKLFRNYAAAQAYCQENGLPTIPSVQLIQGKFKQFDDGLTAALELAVQRGLPGDSRLGKQAALEQLLAALLRLGQELAATDHSAVDAAAVHVAVALKLGGVELRLPARLAEPVAATEMGFLAAPDSQPVGFWNGDLRTIFRQDRFLSRGMPADEPQAIVLAATIARDPALAEAFARFRAFGAKLTNRPVYVAAGQLAAQPATCLSFSDLAKLLPDPNQVMSPAAINRARAGVAERFGNRAGFALVARAASKEYDLLASLGAPGDAADTMGRIIAAIKSGQLRLEPEEDSGWYDYQWYALETLVLPDKAQEAAKLRLSAAYKKRLESAFRTALTKHRATHIRNVPQMTLGTNDHCSGPVKVEIGPELSVEPTATVYLRYARAYRFLQNAMHGVLGQDFLARLHRSSEGAAGRADLDTELRDLILLCYGLYDQLCLEIGQHPEYLPDEMAEHDVAAAKSALQRWLRAPADDPDLALDTRVVVPIADWPDGRTRYWATGGIRLQRVVYEYDQEPSVRGNVEVTFVPKHYYLPTDIFLEFERSSLQPLTQAEYRALSDLHDDEDTLRAALGAPPRPGRFGWPVLAGGIVLVVVLIAAVVIWWRCQTRLGKLQQAVSKRWTKRVRRNVMLAGMVCLVLWLTALIFCTGYRTKLLVRYVAHIDFLTCGVLDPRFTRDRSQANIAALVELHADDDPQTRYLASRFLELAFRNQMSAPVLKEIPGLKARLQAAASDPIHGVAANSVGLLRFFKDQQNVDFLIEGLRSACHIDGICLATITSLAEIGDPQALDAVISMTDDPRQFVRQKVAWSLGSYDDDRAAVKLAELLPSSCYIAQKGVINGIAHSREEFGRQKWEPGFNAAMLAAASKTHVPWYRRLEVADDITDNDLAAKAYAILLANAPTPEEEADVLAGLALAHLGRRSTQFSRVRRDLAKAMLQEEDLRSAIKAAVDGGKHETLKQLIQDSATDDER